MLKMPTMTAIGLAVGLTVGAAGAAAQSQPQAQQGQAGQGQEAQQQQMEREQQTQREMHQPGQEMQPSEHMQQMQPGQQMQQGQQGQQGQMQTRQGGMSGMPVLVIFVDRDRDQMVTREEARQAREEVFLILDTDEDERLTRDEFGGGMTREETARYFGAGDTDRDRRMSAREYLELGEQRYREKAGAAGRQLGQGLSIEEYQETAGITREQAGLADVDRDEMITPDEAAYDTARRFRMLDENDDGYVSHSELRQSDMELRRDREFSQLDENDDDRLSREEFVAGSDWEDGSAFEYRAQEEQRRQQGEGAGMETQSNIGRQLEDEGSGSEGSGESGSN